MTLKPIELLVLQKGELERIQLAEIDLDNFTELSYHFNPVATHQKYWTEINEKYEFNTLIQNYAEGVRKLQQIVREIVQGTNDAGKANLRRITRHPFVYASPPAYQLIKPKIEKEKESDIDILPIAHISWAEGIEYGVFVSLTDDYSYQNILSSNIHEHGHYLHHILNSKHYKDCDSTMRETMAIFMEMKCGLPVNYTQPEPGKETPHHRAQQLLLALEKTELYSGMNTKAQWEFLTEIQAHQSLQELIEDVLSKKQEVGIGIIIDVE